MEDLLAVETADRRPRAAGGDLLDLVLGRHQPVVAEDVAAGRIARVAAALAGLVGLGRPELLPDDVRLLADADDVVHGFAHLGRAVEAHDPAPRPMSVAGSGK
ncbi:MAG: hypothetical protein MZV64_43780 [Ignavibacteriales bacterium]|nr:hypothetical protein [Ignavibacteriales bacterium]